MFEYIGVEDPTRMSREELTEGEVLGRIKKILKDIDCIPLRFEEKDAEHPSASVSNTPHISFYDVVK